jgi:hypothetical protein
LRSFAEPAKYPFPCASPAIALPLERLLT